MKTERKFPETEETFWRLLRLILILLRRFFRRKHRALNECEAKNDQQSTETVT